MYPDSSSASARLFERSCKVLPGGNTRTTVFLSPYPLYAARGRGCRIIDVDGVERIDFLNNYTSLIHGHAHPAIVEAVRKQLELGTCFPMPTESEISLAELLCERVPSVERVRFTNSGSEAVMMAIKAARAFTERPRIAKCEGAYHGSYDFVEVSLDASPENWGEADHPRAVGYSKATPDAVLTDVTVIPFNDPSTAEAILSEHAETLAAVIVDPMPNRVGLIPASHEFLSVLRRFTSEHGVVLIFDEVISFRLGYKGAQQEFGVIPDMTTMGKIIGGGFPVGAVGGRTEVMAVFDPRQGKPPAPHAGTFNANPITMVAGLAAMRLMTPAIYDHLNALGEVTRARLTKVFREEGVPAQVIGRGSLLMFHLHDRPITGYRSAYRSADDKKALLRFHQLLLNQGILIAPHGLCVLSTVMAQAEVDHLVEAVRHAVREACAERPRSRGETA